mmetsp:Transcript_19339/g.29647  ORF Transcript_19339/g.29647 Transcript_19339/m.29647 type:complete len:88 (+) Transcript_19339:37-300(+)
MDSSNKIVARKAGLKKLEKCPAIVHSVESGSCSTVTEIDISHNSISDLSFLEPFSNLTQLIADYNHMKSLESLPLLPHLKVLSLSYN